MKKLKWLIIVSFLACTVTMFSRNRAGADPKLLRLYELDVAQAENRKVESWLKAGGINPSGGTLNVNSLYWTKSNQPWLPVMGEFHYARFPRCGWEDQLLKMKAAGISIVSTYVFWINAENPKGTWNWNDDNDLRYFLQLCQKHGLYVWLRPGPYINAEARNGGLPDWVNKPGKRSDASWYIDEVRKYYSQVAQQTRGLFFKDGGPVIGVQLDNEFAHGDAGHLVTLLNMAKELGMEAPFYTCTNNSKYEYSRGDVMPLQGAYPYRGWGNLEPTTDYLYSSDEWNAMENIGGLPYDGNRFPRGMAELGVACWQNYGQRFIVPVYGSEGHLQNCIGRGINLVGYYMFQGGTQKEGFQGDNHPLNYDFQAPLGEYGQVRPSYHALKLIHHFLNDFGSDVAPMQLLRPVSQMLNPGNTDSLRYIGRFKDDCGFLFLTTTQCWVNMKPIRDIRFKLKLDKETLVFPEKPFTLKANMAPIFPVNLDLNGVRLKYATAQLLCKVQENGIPYFFFFAPEGITPEFALDNATIGKLDCVSTMLNKDGKTIISLSPGLKKAFTVVDKNGKQAVVVLLSRKQAEQSWRLPFRGQERLLLSDANLLIDKDSLELSSNRPSMEFYCFPALKEKVQNAVTGSDGIFSRHSLKVPKVAVKMGIDRISAQECRFKFSGFTKGLKDIFADVDYIGSTCEVWVDGKKYSDDFYNGKSFWDIGLKRFADGNDHQIVLKASRWDDAVKGIDPSRQPHNDAERAGLIRSVTFRPEYQVRVK